MKTEEVTLTVKVKIRHDSTKVRNAVLREMRQCIGVEISQSGVDGYASAKTGAVRIQKPPKEQS